MLIGSMKTPLPVKLKGPTLPHGIHPPEAPVNSEVGLLARVGGSLQPFGEVPHPIVEELAIPPLNQASFLMEIAVPSRLIRSLAVRGVLMGM